MWIIKLFPRKFKFSVPNKARVEPEVERTILVIVRHVTGVGLEQHLRVAF